jgi:hypothetical protein
MKLYKN